MKNTLFCSFCGKSQHEVKKLIAGPSPVFICDECIMLCLDILNREVPLVGVTNGIPPSEDAPPNAKGEAVVILTAESLDSYIDKTDLTAEDRKA